MHHPRPSWHWASATCAPGAWPPPRAATQTGPRGAAAPWAEPARRSPLEGQDAPCPGGPPTPHAGGVGGGRWPAVEQEQEQDRASRSLGASTSYSPARYSPARHSHPMAPPPRRGTLRAPRREGAAGGASRRRLRAPRLAPQQRPLAGEAGHTPATGGLLGPRAFQGPKTPICVRARTHTHTRTHTQTHAHTCARTHAPCAGYSLLHPQLPPSEAGQTRTGDAGVGGSRAGQGAAAGAGAVRPGQAMLSADQPAARRAEGPVGAVAAAGGGPAVTARGAAAGGRRGAADGDAAAAAAPDEGADEEVAWFVRLAQEVGSGSGV
jgi:hypothetical protein